jgi:hypothetical protein
MSQEIWRGAGKYDNHKTYIRREYIYRLGESNSETNSVNSKQKISKMPRLWHTSMDKPRRQTVLSLLQLRKRKKTNMKLVNVRLPDPYIKGLDDLVDQKLYPNRSEAIRAAVRDLLKGEHRNF